MVGEVTVTYMFPDPAEPAAVKLVEKLSPPTCVLHPMVTEPFSELIVPTADGTPYGIAVDHRRSLVYVTLTATNRLESFIIRGNGLIPDRSWPTVRQPNSVAVDQITGRVFVAGRTGSQLEMIDPGRTPS